MILNLNNFRNFKNQDFRFSKINVFVGENSAGKSSLLKFLLVLKQSLLNYQNKTARNITLQGEYTDLGNYKAMIFNHEVQNDLSFTFILDEEYPVYFKEFFREARNRPKKSAVNENLLKVFEMAKSSKTEINVTISKKIKDHNAVLLRIKNNKLGEIEITPTQSQKFEIDKVISTISECVIKYTDQDNNIVHYDKILFEKEAFFSVVLGGSLYDRFEKTESIDFFKIAFFLIAQNYVSDFIDKIQFVNPINSSPKRFVFKSDPSNNLNNLNLEEIINVLTDDTIDRRTTSKLISELNNSMSFLGLTNEIKFSKNNRIPITELIVNVNGIWNSISDVGYGTSLQIPILFQMIVSNKKGGENILIEQPEIHLHPKLHAQFIETMLKFGSKNSYFIETHSEHIIRKLQIMVKNKSYGLSPSDVTIHYFKKDSQIAHISLHNIDSSGKLDPMLPNGFFDNSYNLAKELMTK